MRLRSIHWGHLAGNHVLLHSGISAQVQTQISPVRIPCVCSAFRLLTSSPNLGLYQVASNPALRPTLQFCLELFCDALNAKSAVRYLSHVYENSGTQIPAPEAEDTPSISKDIVTATGLTRAHRNMARSMTSEPAATVTAITTTQVSDGPTASAAGNGSANTSTSSSSTSSSPSSSAAGPKATQNGGTVLDQAGSTGGASSILQAGSLRAMSVSVGCLVVGLAWLW